MSELKNRKDKINFLNDLIQGKKKIHELLPRRILVLEFKDETQTYLCEEMNTEFTEEEFKAYSKRYPRTSFIILHEKIISKSTDLIK